VAALFFEIRNGFKTVRSPRANHGSRMLLAIDFGPELETVYHSINRLN